ncbi:hypothetical protein GCM10020367_55150 [Streptomyces sannanensis]|uniref:DUF1963 domain-containing protein n=1 Tax=Streptomyces sannanensis TaxID=285536 RepID=A0ABP6SJ96_9ACTN
MSDDQDVPGEWLKFPWDHDYEPHARAVFREDEPGELPEEAKRLADYAAADLAALGAGALKAGVPVDPEQMDGPRILMFPSADDHGGDLYFYVNIWRRRIYVTEVFWYR